MSPSDISQSRVSDTQVTAKANGTLVYFYRTTEIISSKFGEIILR